MDLKFLEAEPTAEEREAIDAALGAGPQDQRGHAARSQRHLLLPALHAAQSRVGWISEGAFNHICKRLTVPPADAYGVATFYALFSMSPRPRRVLHVCEDIACRTRGANELMSELDRTVGPPAHHAPSGDHTLIPEDGAAWMRSPCLGLCDEAPAALVTVAGAQPIASLVSFVTPATARSVLAGEMQTESSRTSRLQLPQFGDPALRLLRRIGHIDPLSLDEYRAHGGYRALRRAFDLGPEGVIREVSDAKLLGRGGAAFPTGRKWDSVARQPVRPHYLICNADESEPGTFKDRAIMEGDPFALVEAMTIAGYATGCEYGYLYIRGEYPLALERLGNAIVEARKRGLLGADIEGRGFAFDIEIRKGAGAYICGEETAIFNSIEGYRGEPRNKPPFPAQAGLFGKPTLVNNVETLANVLDIVVQGGLAFAAIGTEQSTGTRLFCLSGNVARPGVYEVPFGVTLRGVLDLAGGVAGGRSLQAVLLGGAAGVFVGPQDLDMPLTFEGVRAADATLGSGVIMLFDDRADLLPMILRIAAFFRDESCGQCVPCRVGTVRQEEALHRISAGQTIGTNADEVSLLKEIGLAMRDASICGLGQTASSAVESAIARLGLFTEAAQ